jgi:hypothetical protein
MQRWGFGLRSLSAGTNACSEQDVWVNSLDISILSTILVAVYFMFVNTFSKIKLNSAGFSIIG